MMRVNVSTSLFLILVTHFFIVSLGRITYNGLVLSSIDVTPVEGKKGFVRFSGGRVGKLNDKTTTFLKDIKQINEKDVDGERIFEAETVTTQEAKEILNQGSADGKGKPLFCVHGFNVQPGTHLKNLKEKGEEHFKQGKFTIVPVLWPSKGGVTAYWDDRDNSAPGAGNAFGLVNTMAGFPNKSLLCHSMGNFVLRCSAMTKIRFDNIFMVAADVRDDLFNKENKDGRNIIKMLRNKNVGKIHVIYNESDHALVAGSWNPTTFFSRLGANGYNKDLLDSKTKHRLTSFNARKHLPWLQIAAHSYHLDKFCVEYYQRNHF